MGEPDDVARWRTFVENIEGITGLRLGKSAEAFTPFKSDRVDSLSISELGMFLLEEFGLDLFEALTFAKARDVVLVELDRSRAQLRPGADVNAVLGDVGRFDRRSGRMRQWGILIRPLAALAVVAGVSLAASGTAAQQQFPPNGLLFHGEAGGLGKRSLFTIQTSHGSLRTLSISIVEGAHVPAVPRTGPRRVGQLRLDSVSSTLTLTLPSHHSTASVTLLRRGSLRVTLAARSKKILRLSGLPAGTTSAEITLNGGKGQLLTSRGCHAEQNFMASATRSGAKSPVHTTAGVTC